MPEESDWFSRYKFLSPLGQGGMGTVYLAEDRSNGNASCVIKQLLNKYTDEAERVEAVRLFKREVAILRQLRHPGVVRVFDDHTTSDHKYFLVMDYVPGKNLDVVIADVGVLDSETVVRIAIQCCDVLIYLHSEDIIYRDVKPSNLMLRPDGRVVFIDFGIARNFLPKEVATRVVTAGYSPPEQYFGKPEKRSDIYALGATLSHLLTGHRPKPLQVCSPRSINPEILEPLDELIKKMTAHSVEERPHSAEQVKYQLFKIYKSIHPSWEMPELPPGTAWDEQDEARLHAELEYAPDKLKERKPAVASGAFKVPPQALQKSNPHLSREERRASGIYAKHDAQTREQSGDTTWFSKVTVQLKKLMQNMGLGG